MFYLTTHSTHFILRLYGVRHMVKNHKDSEKGNPLPPQQGFLYMNHPTDRITHTTAFVTPVVEHWLEREIAQWVHHEGSIRRPIGIMSERSYHGATSRSGDEKVRGYVHGRCG